MQCLPEDCLSLILQKLLCSACQPQFKKKPSSTTAYHTAVATRRTVLRYMSVCRTWRRCIDTPTVWKQMCSNIFPKSSLQLKLYHGSWRSLFFDLNLRNAVPIKRLKLVKPDKNPLSSLYTTFQLVCGWIFMATLCFGHLIFVADVFLEGPTVWTSATPLALLFAQFFWLQRVFTQNRSGSSEAISFCLCVLYGVLPSALYLCGALLWFWFAPASLDLYLSEMVPMLSHLLHFLLFAVFAVGDGFCFMCLSEQYGSQTRQLCYEEKFHYLQYD
eukprot:gnl/Spiro4/8257_TR4366_c0_g1_i1.p1 gnl/Spiro4/8257_TR4366_c0_g1~~gnl/Spiro4/8257_TR4366_c0_g1_i1.p1  ORF type:complete len:273 (-),score=32.02 gnl/Spiro4/8257_TR4366_c0_g1_i1:14-832(-)